MALTRTLLIAALALAAAAGTAQAEVNRNPAFTVVYDTNIENLETASERPCPGDWKDLLYFMKVQKLSPDLITVQQLTNRAQLNDLIRELDRTLPGRYAGIIAQRNPDPFSSPCGAPKARQTNAVIFRKGRFAYVAGSKATWRSNRTYGTRKCRPDGNDRTVNVAVQLRDKINGATVNAASFHWPTGNASGPFCAPKNVRQLVNHVERAPSSLRIMGGDGNVTTAGGRGWYGLVNGDAGGKLGYRDVTFAACGGAPACITANWTVSPSAKRRIDYLFARKGDGSLPAVTKVHTVTFEEAGAAARRVTGGDSPRNYSDHRAVRARIHY
jgi:hypothetical protein